MQLEPRSWAPKYIIETDICSGSVPEALICNRLGWEPLIMSLGHFLGCVASSPDQCCLGYAGEAWEALETSSSQACMADTQGPTLQTTSHRCGLVTLLLDQDCWLHLGSATGCILQKGSRGFLRSSGIAGKFAVIGTGFITGSDHANLLPNWHAKPSTCFHYFFLPGCQITKHRHWNIIHRASAIAVIT